MALGPQGPQAPLDTGPLDTCLRFSRGFHPTRGPHFRSLDPPPPHRLFETFISGNIPDTETRKRLRQISPVTSTGSSKAHFSSGEGFARLRKTKANLHGGFTAHVCGCPPCLFCLSTDVASHKMCDFRICTVLHGFGNARFCTTFEHLLSLKALNLQR